MSLAEFYMDQMVLQAGMDPDGYEHFLETGEGDFGPNSQMDFEAFEGSRRTLYCAGGLVPLERIQAQHAAAGWVEVDYVSAEEDEADAATFQREISEGGYRSVVVEDSLIVDGMFGPAYRSVVVEDSLIADGMFGAALFTPPVLAALRELFDEGGLVAIVAVEGIFTATDRLRQVFGLEWAFHSYTSGDYICQGEVAAQHFSEGAYVKSNNVAAPRGEAMWAAMTPRDEEDARNPCEMEEEDLRLLCEGAKSGLPAGHVGGVSVAVHVGVAGGRVAWFGDASGDAGQDALLRDLAEGECAGSCGAATGAKSCKQCKVVGYCGEACQRRHWPAHKKLCKQLARPVAHSMRQVLLVTGLGPCGPEDFYTQGVRAALSAAGMHVVTCDATMGERGGGAGMFEQVGMAIDRFAVLIVLGLGAADDDADFFSAARFKGRLVEWTRKGGTVLFQGERGVENALRWFDKAWSKSGFDKAWSNSGYTRTDHACNARGLRPSHWCTWYNTAEGAVIETISVKACLLNNVPQEEQLFSTLHGAQTASHVPPMAGVPINAGEFGEGAVGFFGDVNAEECTTQIMAVLARGAP
ncbi:hypothetical protein T484DRAFT_1778506 [Baffinella frigidus]|nr:hypothetical protein T484DRAFT_1778506 [Cryptophyta sp. CCMP2293]